MSQDTNVENVEQTEQVSDDTETVENVSDEQDTDEESSESVEEIRERILGSLDPGKKVMADAMLTAAESALTEFSKVWKVISAQGNPDAVLAAARETSDNEQVVEINSKVEDLESQIADLIEEANEILRNSGAVDLLSEEDLAAKREAADNHRKTFNDTVKYGEDHIVEGFGTMFADTPGIRKRGKSTGAKGEGSYNLTTSIKPKVSAITVDGSALDKATFTELSKFLKSQSGQSVPVGDLHQAWLKAAGTENVEAIQDAQSFAFQAGDKSYQIVITPKESA